MQLKHKHWLPAIAYALLIFYLSSLSVLPPASVGRYVISGSGSWYKHMAEYGIFAMLLLRAFSASRFKHPGAYSVITAALYGVTDEIHQYFVPGRILSYWDMLYNSLGALVVVAFLVLKNKNFLNFRK